MKLSIAWIFQHLDADWRSVDIKGLIDRFNKTTAEIESLTQVKFELDALAAGRVVQLTEHATKLDVPEWHLAVTLPARTGIQEGDWLLLKKTAQQVSWLISTDCGAAKEWIMPPVVIKPGEEQGAWKKRCITHDYIIDVDNKSITNRPDLWGHRGFAREFSALLKVTMIPLDDFLITKRVIHKEHEIAAHGSTRGLRIHDTRDCSRLVALEIPTITPTPSDVGIAFNLVRLDHKPIDAIVDATNVAMLDLGHPMHAFDAHAIKGSYIEVRRAKNKEQLVLLDGTTAELTPDDLVVADAQHAVSLAGVMGGKVSAVTRETKSLLLEAACFDPGVIRKTAARYKKRTEASSRFEKTLDAQQASRAIERFLRIITDLGIAYTAGDEILSVGEPAREKKVLVTHSFIEEKIGIALDPAFLTATLKALGFGVHEQHVAHTSGYEITIPSQRATKDIAIPEDIVEEIARFYGYTAIKQELPRLALKPSSLHAVRRERLIKQVLASGLLMREIQQYAFFDEAFLRELGWDPGATLEVRSPVSENWRRLMTTLVPHLFAAVQANHDQHESLRFFEWARIWHQRDAEVIEQKSLVGIFFEKKKPLDFYQGKVLLQQFFHALGLEVTWHTCEGVVHPWYVPYQTAALSCQGQIIGKAGMIAPAAVSRVIEQGAAFVFELDGDWLLASSPMIKPFVPLAKYPDIERDVSMLVPLALTAHELAHLIEQTDARIIRVTLVDFFQKKEWKTERSLTFRFIIRDAYSTLTKEQADEIWQVVVQRLRNRGATIR
jgi:phenylalanyl-tRNA synthetase beta chain